MNDPLKYFLPYQQRWILDRSPLKIMEKSRQIGISSAATPAFSYDQQTPQATLRFHPCALSPDGSNLHQA